MLTEFKTFLLRANVVDLAVGVVVGAAFGTVVTALVKDLLTPLISAAFTAPDFSNLSFTLNGSKFLYGDFINSIISFVLVASGVFFFVVKPMNLLVARVRREEHAEPTTKTCPECLSAIPLTARRCAHCTQSVV